MYCLQSGQSANKTYSPRKESHRLDKNSIDISGKEVMQIVCTARLLIFFFYFKHKRKRTLQFPLAISLTRGSAHAQERVSLKGIK